MSNWEMIDWNPYTGVRKYLGDNPDDPEGVLVKYEQDPAAVKQIIERNKAVATDSWDRRSDMWHAGHIPGIVIAQWLAEGIDYLKFGTCPETTKKIKAKLNSNEFRDLRVHHFRV